MGMSLLAASAHGEDAISTATSDGPTSSPWAAKRMTKYWSAATTLLIDDDEEGRGLEYACEGNSDVFDGFVAIEDLVAKATDNDFQ